MGSSTKFPKILINAVSGLTEALFAKVDKVTGKGLSTEDYTTAEKTKVSNLSNTNSGDETAARIATILHGVDADTPADADEFGFWKSVGGLFKKVTWANIKATFDALYLKKVVRVELNTINGIDCSVGNEFACTISGDDSFSFSNLPIGFPIVVYVINSSSTTTRNITNPNVTPWLVTGGCLTSGVPPLMKLPHWILDDGTNKKFIIGTAMKTM